jgi:predicted ATP-grasp superfamily ATP-dependent carboligase
MLTATRQASDRRTKRLRLLLTDGSSLTARQVANQAAAAGHRVDVLSPTRLGLAALTRNVNKVHRVPRFGDDPYDWLDAALSVLRRREHDVLLATHEQAALLAHEQDALARTGVAFASPPGTSLRRLQDKVSQVMTLTELDIPQPHWQVFEDTARLVAESSPPVYLKAPIGTASGAVRLAADTRSLTRACRDLAQEGAFADGGIVVQAAAEGPVAMVQAVFEHGSLVAWHANLRLRDGPSGGSSLKVGIRRPEIEEHLRTLGRELHWHSALSLDAVLTEAGPLYIDVNPRLVEPGNAWHSGLDLVEALIGVSIGRVVEPALPRTGVRTHQTLLAVLRAAERGRPAVLREVSLAATGRGPYAGSIEELTPAQGDRLACLPVVAAALVTAIRPQAASWFTEGAVAAYALTPGAWNRIRETTTAKTGRAAAAVAGEPPNA